MKPINDTKSRAGETWSPGNSRGRSNCLGGVRISCGSVLFSSATKMRKPKTCVKLVYYFCNSPLNRTGALIVF